MKYYDFIDVFVFLHIFEHYTLHININLCLDNFISSTINLLIWR